MKKLVQIKYDRFPEDWLKNHGIVKILAVFAADTDNPLMSEDGDKGYEVLGLRLRVIIYRPEVDKDAIIRGINKVGYPLDVWAADAVDSLPFFEELNSLRSDTVGTHSLESLSDNEFEDMLDEDMGIEFYCPPSLS